MEGCRVFNEKIFNVADSGDNLAENYVSRAMFISGSRHPKHIKAVWLKDNLIITITSHENVQDYNYAKTLFFEAP